MKLPNEITIECTITPVHALRIIEIQVPKWKIRPWLKWRYKPHHYFLSSKWSINGKYYFKTRRGERYGKEEN